ncbi:hypothetical protein FA15DRAFT_146574 [Coprinopsis marcescibilis]|uniref:Nephrocystin 3-like N-terminal domain-containing protein n=1 Tax=Coprinopsis marcescibilis TaxID=230819 RepID=A0A5C3L4J2_COPMA|nr:hypothetical protein FA15DRAFT_146574 [Coprinopsis marcescibilis]
MSILQDARNVTLNNSILNAIQYNQLNGLGALVYLQQFCANDATHDAEARYPAPKCHPKTRDRITALIIAWVKRPTDSRVQAVLWLHAPAGMGKTAIAQTISELCENEGLLAATFFFSRGAPQRNRAARLVASIAFQLISSIPELKPHIEEVITSNPAILTKTLPSQLQKLILEPFSKITRSTTDRLVIIDGVDECIGSKDIPKEEEHVLVLELVQTLQEANLPLIFLILCRPESWIRDGFESLATLDEVTLVVDLCQHSDADGDVDAYPRSEFSRINKAPKHRRSMSSVPQPWPSDEAISELVLRASGQFIYAATVIRYVDDPWYRPQERLQQILSSTGYKDGENPLETLDALYREILGQCPDHALTKEVLGCLMCDFSSGFNVDYSPARACETICDWPPNALRGLHSLIRIDDGPSHQQSIFYHATFIEFLESPSRSKEFHFRKYQYMGLLLEKCLVYLSRLPPDISLDPPPDAVVYALYTWQMYNQTVETEMKEPLNEEIGDSEHRPQDLISDSRLLITEVHSDRSDFKYPFLSVMQLMDRTRVIQRYQRVLTN